MKWFLITKALWLHISVAAVDYDGVYNHLLMSKKGPGTNYVISLSLDEPLKYELNEWFYGTVKMKCQKVWTLLNDENTPRHGGWGTPERAHICNASELTVDGKTYKLSSKRQENERSD